MNKMITNKASVTCPAVTRGIIAPNALRGVTLIERTDSVVKILPGQNNQTKYEREGQDTRTFAWHEVSPYYNTSPVIVSRTYTFNGKDAWDYTETRI